MNVTIFEPSADTVRARLWRSILKEGARRSFLLLGIGATIGLVLAGIGLFTAKGTKINIIPPEDIALINGQPILVVDFDAQLKSTFGVDAGQATFAQKQQTLHDMIREEIYVQRGIELGMTETDPNTRNDLVNAVEQQVLAQITTENPTERQLQDYYVAHRSRYYTPGSISLTDLLVPGGDTPAALKAAGEAAEAMRAKAPLADVVKKYGLIDTKKTSGQEFYFAAKIHLGDKLFAAATKLKPNQISDPVKIEDGYHILDVATNEPSVPLSFVNARSIVESDYKNNADASLQAEEEKFLTNRAQIQIAGRYRQYECKEGSNCKDGQENMDAAVINAARAQQKKELGQSQ